MISSFKSQGKHIFKEIGIGSKENNQFGGFLLLDVTTKFIFNWLEMFLNITDMVE